MSMTSLILRCIWKKETNLIYPTFKAFPFDPNPNWSRFYSSGAEIQEYITRTAKKWNLDRDVQLNTKVTSAQWQEEAGEWKITVERDGKSRDMYADILVSGQGVLL